jgi:hypothetical protein
VQVLAGDVERGAQTHAAFYGVWRRFGFTPEGFNLVTQDVQVRAFAFAHPDFEVLFPKLSVFLSALLLLRGVGSFTLAPGGGLASPWKAMIL